MAHPYTTRARLDALVRPARMVALLDVDQDGTEDSGVFTDAIERAANAVDADLARLYSVPFAAVTDSPATPGIISDLTDYYAAAWLFRVGGAPNSADADALMAEYTRLLGRIRAGEAAVPGAAEAAADSGIAAIVSAGEAPQFAGVDSRGVRRSEGLF